MEQGTSEFAATASEAEVKLCECGCGEPAPLARETNRKRGHVKGQPIRFIHGHNTTFRGPRERLKKLSLEPGERVGRSTVVDPDVTWEATGARAARMRCDCGTEFVRRIALMFQAATPVSCGGCSARADLEGQRFGRLTVVRWAPGRTDGGSRQGKWVQRWLCRCDCGNEVLVAPNRLTGGWARSCGCGTYGPRKGLALGEAPFNSLLRTYRQGAEERGYSWALGEEEFRRLTALDCCYCGTAPATVRRTGQGNAYVYNGIDRVDNTRGYEPGNVVPCCGTCNKRKGDLPYDEWMAWIFRLVAFYFFHPEMLPSQYLARQAGS